MRDNVRDKNYLKRGISISFDTAVVGSITVLEKEFGQLWGFNKKGEDLTEDELKWLEVWERVRTELFDRGNKAKGILKDTVDKFAVEKRIDYFQFSEKKD